MLSTLEKFNNLSTGARTLLLNLIKSYGKITPALPNCQMADTLNISSASISLALKELKQAGILTEIAYKTYKISDEFTA